jgi:hypothetical protein
MENAARGRGRRRPRNHRPNDLHPAEPSETGPPSLQYGETHANDGSAAPSAVHHEPRQPSRSHQQRQPPRPRNPPQTSAPLPGSGEYLLAQQSEFAFNPTANAFDPSGQPVQQPQPRQRQRQVARQQRQQQQQGLEGPPGLVPVPLLLPEGTLAAPPGPTQPRPKKPKKKPKQPAAERALKPHTARGAGREAAAARSIDDLPHCLVCCSPAALLSVGECNHSEVCASCCLRLRVGYDRLDCPLCKRVLEQVGI